MCKSYYCTDMSRVMRNPAFCICENKDTDQLRGYREADQRLCFRYIDSSIPLLPKSKIFKLLAIFCDCTARFMSDLVRNPKTGFLTTRLICSCYNIPSRFTHQPSDLTPLHSLQFSSLQLRKGLLQAYTEIILSLEQRTKRKDIII